MDFEIPASREAEAALLGAALIDPEKYWPKLRVLSPEHFSDARLKAVFTGMKDLRAVGGRIEAINLLEHLKKQNTAQGNRVTLGEISNLSEGVPIIDAGIGLWIEIVRENFARREFQRLAYESAVAAGSKKGKIESLFQQTIVKLEAIKSEFESFTGQSSLGSTFEDFEKLELPPRDEIIFGLSRGEIGALCAVTNKGKSTFARNLAISAATGKPFPPLGDFEKPLRVAILDFEDSPAKLKTDLQTMLVECNEFQRQEFGKRCWIKTDIFQSRTEQISLSNSRHFEGFVRQLTDHGADLIMVDTTSRAFEIEDENGNAEAINKIIRPLHSMARRTGAAILIIRHIGKAKQDEARSNEASHKARGASSVSDHCHLILNIEAGKDDTIKLCCAKVKGETFADQIFMLDRPARWFRPVMHQETVQLRDRIFELFRENSTLKTGEIVTRLSPPFAERTIKGQLKQQVQLGKLEKISHGRYSLRTTSNESANSQSV